MVDLQKPSGVRNYFSRREQFRLLMLVMSLGLIFILMNEVRNPANWKWFERLDAAASQPNKQRASKQVGNSFSIPPKGEKSTTQPAASYLPGVESHHLKAIRDNTPFRAKEKDAWFHLLGLLKNNEETTLQKSSIGRVSFTQLFFQSKEYRGLLVSIKGQVVGVRRKTAPKNNLGISSYYQLWVQSEERPDEGFVIYCLELPQQFPSGNNLREAVDITGFYFKRWTTPEANGQMNLLPTLLSKTVHWHRRPSYTETASRSYGFGSVMLAILGAMLFAVSFVVYIVRRTPRGAVVEPVDLTVFDGLEEADSTNPTDNSECNR